jgi:hypothetical protein
MGWTGTFTDAPAAELITDELEYGGRHRVIKRSGRYYAVEDIATGEVFAVVGLSSRREGWVYTKLVDEGMGPNERACPKSILNLLTPTDSEYAKNWREECRQELARKARQPKLKAGDVVRLAEPVEFKDGRERDTFTFVKHFTFTDPYGGRVRLPKDWKRRYEWEKIEAPEVPKEERRLSFMPTRASAEFDAPLFKVSGRFGTISYWVVKRYADDDTAEHARWMVGADLGLTYGAREYGDEYVANVVTYAKTLDEVGGREPTEDERREYQLFRQRVMSNNEGSDA